MASRLSLTGVLVVAMDGVEVGEVRRSRAGELSFTYLDGTPSHLVVSPHLPVSSRTYGHAAVEPLLAGLLPDNEAVRRRWAGQFATDETPFDLLAHMGLDCAGAIQFARPEERHLLVEGAGDLIPVSRGDIAVRLKALRAPGGESGWTQPREQWSLAGAQGKFTLAQGVDGSWYEPLGTAPSTHIIKPGITGMTSQAAVEFATTRAAARLGLRTTSIEYADFEGQEAVVIERFDRVRLTPADRILRLHQVDLCMAAGVMPGRKYERDRGPSAAALASIVRRHTREADVVRFSDALLFNYLSNSPDAHSKNFALLYGGTRARLAPLYDLATGLPYDKNDAPVRSAFRIGGVANFGEAYEKHFVRHAEEFGLDVDERLGRVRDLAARIPEAMREAMLTDLGGEVGATLWRRTSSGPGRIDSFCRRVVHRLA
ncbi:HipA domain-containing protein [Nocardioides sp.]|uniref:HipA domain-containing protein n=1 Tax=Nocardioides sp. TaxID=35761 RepID=UPI0026385F7F|nr:HipA domain-containing protein [Nocardioides sp.]